VLAAPTSHARPRAGLDYLQPVTALCLASLLYLVYNVAWRWTAGRRLPPEAHAARSMRLEAVIYQQVRAWRTAGLKVALRRAPPMIDPHPATSCCPPQVQGRLLAAAVHASHLLAALAVLLHRALQGQRLGATFWTVVSLWGLVLLGEARLLSHSWTVSLAYATAFSLPWAYLQCRRAMDAFVAESVHWALTLLLGANRLGAVMAVAAAGLVLSWGALGLVLRLSLAMAVSLSILAWQNGYIEAESVAQAAALQRRQRQHVHGD
jgi:hypothetical protein